MGGSADAIEPVPPTADEPPLNVLMIAVDDLKPAIAAYGDPHAVTPRLDQLAQRGTVFLNAHCQQAVCAPSRVSLLLGLRPDTTGVWDLHTRFRKVLPDVVTLPQHFKQAGYHTAGVGKVFDYRSVDSPTREMDARSWSEPFVYLRGDPRHYFGFRNPDTLARIDAAITDLGGVERLPDNYRERLEVVFGEQGRPSTDRADVPDNAYRDGRVTDIAIDQIEQHAAHPDRPFFLAVGFYKPHLPFNAPEPYWSLYDRESLPLAEFTRLPDGTPRFVGHNSAELRNAYDLRDAPWIIPEDKQRELVHGYYACVSFIDAQIGRLIDALDRTAQAQRTIIVLWGDHGWHLGDHALWCKHSNFEQATRSPLIIVDPRRPGGVRTSAPVEFVDLYPTLTDLAGLDPPPHTLHGVSLQPLLTDPDADVKPVAVSQYPRKFEGRPAMGYAFRDRRYRYVQWRQTDYRNGEFDGPIVATELYDYEVDPLETRNLAEDPAYAGALARMHEHARVFHERAASTPNPTATDPTRIPLPAQPPH